MSKPLDTRQVEYAYVMEIRISPNQQTADGGFRHGITIFYEIKDADKNLLGERHIQHFIDGERLTTSGIVALLSDNLHSLVRADKLELSGYDIAE
jgi:hypothetical protein